MDYYIVRIYRRDEKEERNVTGLVETVGCDDVNVFKSRDELWNILSGRATPQDGARKVRRKGSEG